MKLFLIYLALLFIGADNPNKSIQGTYYNKYGKTNKAPFGLLQIHYINKDNYLFYLEVNRGAPGYNSGALYGRLTLNRKSGNSEYLPLDTTDGCKLEFNCDKNKITIKTVTGDCGFGYGVFADGFYLLKDDKNPINFVDRTGKKIYFDKTPPEKFSED